MNKATSSPNGAVTLTAKSPYAPTPILSKTPVAIAAAVLMAKSSNGQAAPRVIDLGVMG